MRDATIEERVTLLEKTVLGENGLRDQMDEILSIGRMIKWGMPTAIALLGLLITLKLLP